MALKPTTSAANIAASLLFNAIVLGSTAFEFSRKVQGVTIR